MPALCPSCSIECIEIAGGDRCPRCGAERRGRHWRHRRLDVAEIQPADPQDYVLCKSCTAAKGREILWPHEGIVKETKSAGLFRKSRDDPGTITVYKCPKGHVLEGYAPPAAA